MAAMKKASQSIRVEGNIRTDGVLTVIVSWLARKVGTGTGISPSPMQE